MRSKLEWWSIRRLSRFQSASVAVNILRSGELLRLMAARGVDSSEAVVSNAGVGANTVRRPFWRRPIHLSALIAPPRYAAIGFGALLLAVAAYISDKVTVSRSPNPFALPEIVLSFGSLALLLAVALDAPGRPWRRWTGARWIRPACAIATGLMALQVILIFLVGVAFLYVLLTQDTAHAYWNDVISFSDANARALLAGHNPYTDDADFLVTLVRFPQAPPTPLQGPVFGYGAHYPIPATVFAMDKAYQQDPSRYAAAFDPRTLHSYPALSFLLYLPLVALGQDILWLHMALYLGLLLWLMRLAGPVERGWVAFTAAAAVTVPLRSLMIETEIVCLAFLLVAWHWRDRRWVSAVALGLGCAFKQYCWLFAPFLLLDVWRREGGREALRRGMIAGGAFLLPNLPFIVANPQAWATSVLLPVTDPVFPQGFGLVALSLGRLTPLWPHALFTVAEVAGFAALLWVYVRWWRSLQGATLLLPALPLLLGFRSPANYFAMAPWIALYCLLAVRRKRAEHVSPLEGAREVVGSVAGGAVQGGLG